MVFLPKKHLFLVQKLGYGYRGYPPLPLYGQNFWQKGGYGFGGYPPPLPLYGQNPQSSIWCRPLSVVCAIWYHIYDMWNTDVSQVIILQLWGWLHLLSLAKIYFYTIHNSINSIDSMHTVSYKLLWYFKSDHLTAVLVAALPRYTSCDATLFQPLKSTGIVDHMLKGGKC